MANRLSIPDRGLLKEGMFADIVVFDPETVADRATYETPHQVSTGTRDVFVNGVAVVRATASIREPRRTHCLGTGTQAMRSREMSPASRDVPASVLNPEEHVRDFWAEIGMQQDPRKRLPQWVRSRITRVAEEPSRRRIRQDRCCARD